MGYDVTYHPITREEMHEWFFEPLQSDSAIDRLAEKYGFIAKNFRLFLEQARDFPEGNSDYPFETSYGLWLAATQGLFRRYVYFRNSLFTSLIENDPAYTRYTQSFRYIVPEEYRTMKFSDMVVGNWCGGVYIPPEKIPILIHDYENDPAVAEALEDVICDIDLFLDLLRYCEQNEYGLLEATEVAFPFADEYMSDVSHAEFDFTEKNRECSPFLTSPLKKQFEHNGTFYWDDVENKIKKHRKGAKLELPFSQIIVENILDKLADPSIDHLKEKSLLKMVRTESAENGIVRLFQPKPNDGWIATIAGGLSGLLIASLLIIQPPWYIIAGAIITVLCFTCFLYILNRFRAPKEDGAIVVGIGRHPVLLDRETPLIVRLSGINTFDRLRIELVCDGPKLDEVKNRFERGPVPIYIESLLDIVNPSSTSQNDEDEFEGMTFRPIFVPTLENVSSVVSWKIVVELVSKDIMMKREFPFIVVKE